MDEIKTDTGERIPVSQVKRILGGLHQGMNPTGPYDDDFKGPFHLLLELVDGRVVRSQNYPDEKTAYEARDKLETSIE